MHLVQKLFSYIIGGIHISGVFTIGRVVFLASNRLGINY